MRRACFRIVSVLVFTALLFMRVRWSDVTAYQPDAASQSIILYVRQGANGSCASWADACDLQTAILNAITSAQIWVAAGTYYPTTDTNRGATFQLKSGVAIYGGFPEAGGEWNERDWEVNSTSLSGDIGILNNTGDNSYHVVTGSGVDGTAVLDGFTITAGNAQYYSPIYNGGGIYNVAGSPTLTNLIFSANSAYNSGGGMYNERSSPTVTNVTFFNNVTSGSGGGMYNFLSSPNLTDVTFTGNTSAGNGGAMVNNGESHSLLTNVAFSGNHSNFNGGGIYNYAGASSTLTKVTFSNNSAANVGGGISNTDNYAAGNLLLTNVTFSGNHAGFGGGLENTGGNPVLTNVTFSDNRAIGDWGYGGGMYTSNGNPSLTNVTFSGNSATNYGGGMYNINGNPNLTNATFFNNAALLAGGGMYNAPVSQPSLTNAILWDNIPDQIFGPATVSFSDVQGGHDGSGNIDADPLLGGLLDNGGFTQTHSLGAESPAIDAGSPTDCPTTDQRGYVRPTDGNGDGAAVCDMGAYEYASYPVTFTLNVDYVGNGTVTKDPDKLEYLWGESVTLTPVSDPGWTFSGWSGDASGSDDPLSFTIQADTNVTATFDQDEYTLSVTPIGSGTVAVDPLQSTYHHGDVLTLTPTAEVGWTFSGWGGDASGSDDPLTITIQADTSVTATFTQDEYTLTVTPSGSGTVIRDPARDTYHYGDLVTLTASADPSWNFTGWGGDASGADNPLTITITGNMGITALFITNNIYLPILLR